MGKYDLGFQVIRLIEAYLAGRAGGCDFETAWREALGEADRRALDAALEEERAKGMRKPADPPLSAEAKLRTYILGDPRLEVKGSRIRLRSPRETAALLSRNHYVVFDLETTGVGLPHRITEIGAIRVRGGEPGETFQSLVNPGEPIPERVVKFTGITDDMVKDAPTIEKALPRFLDFAGDACLVAHNMPFDAEFVNHEKIRLDGAELPHDLLCTVRLARRLLPDLPAFHLDDVARHFGIPVGVRHRSLGDVVVTAAALVELLKLNGEKG